MYRDNEIKLKIKINLFTFQLIMFMSTDITDTTERERGRGFYIWSMSMTVITFLLLSSSSLNVTEIVSSSRTCDDLPMVRWGRGIIGVNAGDGIGVGNSRIGDKHLFILPGISRRIVGGWRRFWVGADLCALIASSTGTSMVLWR